MLKIHIFVVWKVKMDCPSVLGESNRAQGSGNPAHALSPEAEANVEAGGGGGNLPKMESIELCQMDMDKSLGYTRF
ncbi:hypothetical protein CsSME_00047156 [Camellia sinensis var. sinensis]